MQCDHSVRGATAMCAVRPFTMYKKVVLITRRPLAVSSELCFGSRRANLGMPGELVIQERLVALKSADFLGTKVWAMVGCSQKCMLSL